MLSPCCIGPTDECDVPNQCPRFSLITHYPADVVVCNYIIVAEDGSFYHENFKLADSRNQLIYVEKLAVPYREHGK